MNTTPICQSCGTPMMNSGDFGTNTNGSTNEDYCTYCFQQGEFTMPAKSVEEMIEKLAAMHNQMGLSEEAARKLATENLPKLKRWSKE